MNRMIRVFLRYALCLMVLLSYREAAASDQPAVGQGGGPLHFPHRNLPADLIRMSREKAEYRDDARNALATYFEKRLDDLAARREGEDRDECLEREEIAALFRELAESSREIALPDVLAARYRKFLAEYFSSGRGKNCAGNNMDPGEAMEDLKATSTYRSVRMGRGFAGETIYPPFTGSNMCVLVDVPFEPDEEFDSGAIESRTAVVWMSGDNITRDNWKEKYDALVEYIREHPDMFFQACDNWFAMFVGKAIAAVDDPDATEFETNATITNALLFRDENNSIFVNFHFNVLADIPRKAPLVLKDDRLVNLATGEIVPKTVVPGDEKSPSDCQKAIIKIMKPFFVEADV